MQKSPQKNFNPKHFFVFCQNASPRPIQTLIKQIEDAHKLALLHHFYYNEEERRLYIELSGKDCLSLYQTRQKLAEHIRSKYQVRTIIWAEDPSQIVICFFPDKLKESYI